MILTLSHNVHSGDAVFVRGHRICRCGANTKFDGIYSAGESRTTLNMNGVLVNSCHPAGVVVKGLASARRG